MMSAPRAQNGRRALVRGDGVRGGPVAGAANGRLGRIRDRTPPVTSRSRAD